MKKTIPDSVKGQLLIESMIAISVISVGILSILMLLYRSLSLNRVVADQYVAANLAAEGVEVVKNIIDSNYLKGGTAWNEGINDGCYEVDYLSQLLERQVSGALSPLYFDSASKMYSYERSGVPTAFIRSVCVENSSDGNRVKVNSETEWTTRGGGRFSVNVEDYFFNWKP